MASDDAADIQPDSDEIRRGLDEVAQLEFDFEFKAPPDYHGMVTYQPNKKERSALKELEELARKADRKPKGDPVVRPSYYTQYAIEPIEFIIRNELNFPIGNIIKYLMRAGHKPGNSEIQDLRKAARYLEMYISHLEANPVL